MLIKNFFITLSVFLHQFILGLFATIRPTFFFAYLRIKF